MLFKKKTAAEIAVEDREIINNNGKAVDKLIMLAEGNEAVVARLKDLSEKLKYLKPITAENDIQTDKKISDRIDDIKIELARSRTDSESKIDGIISDILLLLVSRKD